MDLVGACKEDFKKWLSETKHPAWCMMFEGKSEITKNAYYIEFFDTKGINILINNLDYQNWWWYDIKHFPNTTEGKNMFNSRQEALKEGIKKAVEIYNK